MAKVEAKEINSVGEGVQAEALVPLKINASSSDHDDGVSFPLKLPKEGLALRSVGVVDGIPEFRFDATHAPNIPTITEEDIATVFRLAKEGKRPEFFYLDFPPTHPLYLSRKFKQYSPTWLRGTRIGELLAEADWSMKCLQVGTRSNKEKTVFKSWSKESRLHGLATSRDFPRVADSGSVIMSCQRAKIQKSDDEILFPEEPKMQIKADTSPLYTKYITEIFPSVAYYDEPLFAGVQELIKLILGVEWLLKEKGVQVSRDWMMQHTCKSTKTDAHLELGTRKILPHPKKSHRNRRKKLPKSPRKPMRVFKRPTSYVTAKTREAEMYSTLHDVERCYGYYDFGCKEIVMFKEDGTLCQRQKCVKFCFEHQSSTEHQLIASFTGWSPEEFVPAKVRDELLNVLQQKSLTVITSPMPLVVDTTETVDVFSDKSGEEDSGVELKCVCLLQPCPPLALPPLKQTTVVRATVDNYDKLYSSMDPNTPIRPDIPGICEKVIPDVQSWDELISELSVPIPAQSWKASFMDVCIPASCGGVTTRHIPVEEEPLPRKVPRDQLTVVRGYIKGML